MFKGDIQSFFAAGIKWDAKFVENKKVWRRHSTKSLRFITDASRASIWMKAIARLPQEPSNIPVV